MTSPSMTQRRNVVDVRIDAPSCMIVGRRPDASTSEAAKPRGGRWCPQESLRATIRVTVVGDAGRADLAVPLWVDVASLARGYAEAVGTDDPLLATIGGGPAGRRQHRRAGRAAARRRPGRAGARRRAQPRRRGCAAAHGNDSLDGRPHGSGPCCWSSPAACGLGGAAVLAVAGASGVGPGACLVLLLVCAAVRGAPDRPAPRVRAPGRVRRRAPRSRPEPVSPRRTAHGPGGLLLGLAVAALAAAVFAAVGRAFLDPDHDELVEVWLVVGGALAVAGHRAAARRRGSAHGAVGGAVRRRRWWPHGCCPTPLSTCPTRRCSTSTGWPSPPGRPASGRAAAAAGAAWSGSTASTTVVHRGLRLVAAGTFVIAGDRGGHGSARCCSTRGRDLPGHRLARDGRARRRRACAGRPVVPVARCPASRCGSRRAGCSASSASWCCATSGPTTDWVVFASASGLALLVHRHRGLARPRLAVRVVGPRRRPRRGPLRSCSSWPLLPLASGFFDVVRGFAS